MLASTASHRSYRCTLSASLQVNHGNAVESRSYPMCHLDELKSELQPPARLQSI